MYTESIMFHILCSTEKLGEVGIIGGLKMITKGIGKMGRGAGKIEAMYFHTLQEEI